MDRWPTDRVRTTAKNVTRMWWVQVSSIITRYSHILTGFPLTWKSGKRGGLSKNIPSRGKVSNFEKETAESLAKVGICKQQKINYLKSCCDTLILFHQNHVILLNLLWTSWKIIWKINILVWIKVGWNWVCQSKKMRICIILIVNIYVYINTWKIS